jgi:hypothetical protein
MFCKMTGQESLQRPLHQSLRWTCGGPWEPTSTSFVVASPPARGPLLARASGAAELLSGPPLTVAPLSLLLTPRR